MILPDTWQTLIQRFIRQTHRTTEQNMPERSQGLRHIISKDSLRYGRFFIEHVSASFSVDQQLPPPSSSPGFRTNARSCPSPPAIYMHRRQSHICIPPRCDGAGGVHGSRHTILPAALSGCIWSLDRPHRSWAAGFSDYISGSEELLYAASTGTPVDVQQGSGIGMTLVMILLIPALIAGVACGIMAASMKTARRKTDADYYSRSVQITGRHDRFITRTVVRQKIESSYSSGGGTRINSGGFSGKSGKF